MSVVCTNVFVLIIMCIHELLLNVIIMLFKNKNISVYMYKKVTKIE